MSPAGVVGGGGPSPGGQRGARHQDHPVEQHPCNGEHDEEFLDKYLLMVHNVYVELNSIMRSLCAIIVRALIYLD